MSEDRHPPLLPAIDRLGVRVVVGDKVILDRGTKDERAGVVILIDGVLVTIRLTHEKGREIPLSTPAKIDCREQRLICANELEVLR